MVAAHPERSDMAYLFLIVVVAGFFTLNVPARQAVAQQLSRATASIQSSADITRARDYVQTKAMDFIRTELHRIIDATVK